MITTPKLIRYEKTETGFKMLVKYHDSTSYSKQLFPFIRKNFKKIAQSLYPTVTRFSQAQEDYITHTDIFSPYILLVFTPTN